MCCGFLSVKCMERQMGKPMVCLVISSGLPPKAFLLPGMSFDVKAVSDMMIKHNLRATRCVTRG